MGGRSEQPQQNSNSNWQFSDKSTASVKTSIRRCIGSVSANHQQPEPGISTANKFDMNEDTCFLGSNFIVLEYTTSKTYVYAYDKEILPWNNVPIVSGITAWDDLVIGQIYTIIINEALYYGTKLDHSLINPNQIRAYGISFWDNPYDKEKLLII